MNFEDGIKRGLGHILEQARKAQSDIERARDEVLNMEVVGQAGGGLVKVTMTGRHQARKVDIDPSLLGDLDMLQDLVCAAINDAVHKAERAVTEKVGSFAGNIRFPDLKDKF
jgi:DNA-binding YbaB/EbfC family protein